MSEPTPTDLEYQVQQLLDYCQQLKQQNSQLRTREQALKLERNQLRQTCDSTQKKIEAMISRFKAMEQ
ncbi:MAG: cell division protein ZapB [Motiliproteus sp.]|jgi:cell division protein ZapB